MVNWFWEVITVLTYSRRTWWAFFVGILGYFLIQIWGDHSLNSFELTGPMSVLSDAIRGIIDQRYDKAALGCLFSFWALAIKCFMKDRKRFYGAF